MTETQTSLVVSSLCTGHVWVIRTYLLYDPFPPSSPTAAASMHWAELQCPSFAMPAHTEISPAITR